LHGEKGACKFLVETSTTGAKTAEGLDDDHDIALAFTKFRSGNNTEFLLVLGGVCFEMGIA
jgi:hypothetical protein